MTTDVDRCAQCVGTGSRAGLDRMHGPNNSLRGTLSRRTRHPITDDDHQACARSRGGRPHMTLIGQLAILRFNINSTPRKTRRRRKTRKWIEAMSKVARAVESGATTTRSVIDATGLSRLKVERALHALEKQKLLSSRQQGLQNAWNAGGAARPAMRILQ